MNRRPFIALAFLCAAFGGLDAARAGTITYDWVTPDWNFGDSGTHLVGAITVDSTGISSTPIDLTISMIQSWQISVFDSFNTLLFSLSSATDGIAITDTLVHGRTENVPPEITTTSIFLPALPGGTAVEFYDARFHIFSSTGSPIVSWDGDLDGLSQTSLTVRGSTGDIDAQFMIFPNTEIEIAHNPEPASLVIWSLAAAVVGVGYGRKRRRESRCGSLKPAARTEMKGDPAASP